MGARRLGRPVRPAGDRQLLGAGPGRARARATTPWTSSRQAFGPARRRTGQHAGLSIFAALHALDSEPQCRPRRPGPDRMPAAPIYLCQAGEAAPDPISESRQCHRDEPTGRRRRQLVESARARVAARAAGLLVT